MWMALVTVGAVACAVGAILANRLLVSALWLASSSAFVALLIYMLGAPEVAVIELSVGAGLVTVLFVFAINIAGDEAVSTHALIPRPLALALIAVALLLLGWLCLPRTLVLPSPVLADFSKVLWQDRGLDVLIQLVIIFAGVLGVLGLLADKPEKGYAEKELPL